MLLLTACYQFEFPQHFVDVSLVPDGSVVLPGGEQPDESYTSCPALTGSERGDGGLAPHFDTLTVDLPTSIGLVSFPSTIPIGCQVPLTAIASLGTTAVKPQPIFGFSSRDAGVASLDAQGLITGVGEGVTAIDVDAGTRSATRQLWVGGDATLSLTPGSNYTGFTTALHATATAGTLTGTLQNATVTAHFSMRQGTGLDAVERSLVLQLVGATLVEGQTPPASITYREFGEHLPGRVRDFTGRQELSVERVSNRTIRLAFTDLELAGVNGAVKLSGHLEFTAP